MRYAEVIVDINSAGLDRVFTYALPDGLCDVELGTRVETPFGFRKSIEGYIIGLKDECDLPPEKVKVVTRALDDYPALLPELIELARWLKRRCNCNLVDALRLMIPAQMRGGRVHEKTERVARLLVSGDDFDKAVAAQARAPKRAELLKRLVELGGEANASALVGNGSRDALNKLCEQGYVELCEREQLRRPHTERIADCSKHVLTRAQQSALDELLTADAYNNDVTVNPSYADQPQSTRFMLHGVTGSGKTEVYMSLIDRLLAEGKTAILLVPEISLTPQMADHFRNRFGELSALLHSRLSAGERYDEWRRIRRGDARVVIGARSAVFAPVQNLGAIIIDEEHEQSYVSDKRPCYDAREVAQQRCEEANAVLLLGSATPSISSYMRCMPGVRPENRLTLLELPERVNKRPLPEVEIVDMREELLMGNRGVFSSSLSTALRETVERGEQAILLLNRRGYSTFISCRACGYVVKCDQCDVAMTYHLVDGSLKCHYCGATKTPPKTCPECGSPYIKYFGAGTQKVEQELGMLLPTSGVLRMDMDTTSGKDAHAKLLGAFGRGEAQVLVGTQMVAKGLDFPNVTLVGVIAADTSLYISDYRGFERTFELLTQAAGRAGRAERPGRVIVQTYDPDNYAITLAAAQDYRAFYMEETKRRRHGLYPPFTILARLLVEGKDAERARQVADTLDADVKAFLQTDDMLQRQVLQIITTPAPIARLMGLARFQVFVRLYARGPSERVIAKLSELEQREYENVKVVLEINPANMA